MYVAEVVWSAGGSRGKIDSVPAEREITADQRIYGLDDHPFGKAAHFGDQPGQLLQIAVERLGGVFGTHVPRLSRSGR